MIINEAKSRFFSTYIELILNNLIIILSVCMYGGRLIYNKPTPHTYTFVLLFRYFLFFNEFQIKYTFNKEHPLNNTEHHEKASYCCHNKRL